MTTETTHRILQRSLTILFWLCALTLAGWCAYFFYTNIYQTLTAEQAIVSLEPNVGRTSPNLRQLHTLLTTLEEKKKAPEDQILPTKNPFINESLPRISNQPIAPRRR